MPRSRSRSPQRRSRSPPRRHTSRSLSPRGRSRSPPRRYGGGGRRRRTPSRSYSRSPSRSRSPYGRRRPMSPPRPIDPTDVLGVFGLSPSTTEETLRQHFEPYGKIKQIKLIVDGKTKASKGFGFIYFETVDDAIKAKQEGHESILDGVSIRTDFSRTARAHSPTPGTYLGRRSHSRRNGPDRRRDREPYGRYGGRERHYH